MRILIFGGNGMLGHKLVQRLSDNADVRATLRGSYSDVERFGLLERTGFVEGVDVEDANNVRHAIESVQPDVVINAVGVVKQLPSSKDTIRTLTVNSILPHRLSQFSSEFGFRLFCISTDCVFDGVKGGYAEADIPNATDLYGKSKNLGEVTAGNAVTLRSSIIGRELRTSHSLVEWFLSNRGGTVKGFANATYSGFPTIVLADIIKSLIFDFPKVNGLYHVSSDPINKFDLLVLLNNAFGANIAIERDEEFRIDRSLDSSEFRRLTGWRPRGWEEMIEEMANDPTPYESWRK